MRTFSIAALVLTAAAVFGQEYSLGPGSLPQPGVPKGKVTKHTWSTSRVFPRTTRDYWVYVPAQYDGSKAACVTIFPARAWFRARSSRSSALARWMKAIAPLRRQVVRLEVLPPEAARDLGEG